LSRSNRLSRDRLTQILLLHMPQRRFRCRERGCPHLWSV
jgi:hypothetical protein